MKRVALVLKRQEEQALLLGSRITRYIKETGREVLLESSLSDFASQWGATVTDNLADEADLMVVLGGDGTILRAASMLNDKAVPVLGINLGRVGYMADVPPHKALRELQSVLEGSAHYVKRMMLQVSLPDGKVRRVLNDVVIHWRLRARLIDLQLRLGDSREIEVRADGLIVCTPIGSTAYCYAADGPLVHPEIEATILTPICPYSGLQRALVIPPDMETELVLKKGEALTLTFDGFSTVDLESGQSVRIIRSPVPFVMVRTRAHEDYFDVLKEKLGLL